MQRLSRRERALVGLWVVLAIVLWNRMYDMVLIEGIKEYLFRSAMHEAGRGPDTTIAAVLDGTVFKAIWISTFWASVVMLAGMITIRALRRPDDSR